MSLLIHAIHSLQYLASVYMVNTASPTQPRNEEQRPTETELRTNDNNNNNDNEAMPETNIDLTGPPSLEAIKSGDVKEVINDVPPRIDSQGTLSPEAKKEVFVDIPVSFFFFLSLFFSLFLYALSLFYYCYALITFFSSLQALLRNITLKK